MNKHRPNHRQAVCCWTCMHYEPYESETSGICGRVPASLDEYRRFTREAFTCDSHHFKASCDCAAKIRARAQYWENAADHPPPSSFYEGSVTIEVSAWERECLHYHGALAAMADALEADQSGSTEES